MGIHYIIDDFKGCGKYVPVFPADAISEGDPIFVIDKGICIDCGSCDDVCPVDATKWDTTA